MCFEWLIVVISNQGSIHECQTQYYEAALKLGMKIHYKIIMFQYIESPLNILMKKSGFTDVCPEWVNCLCQHCC